MMLRALFLIATFHTTSNAITFRPSQTPTGLPAKEQRALHRIQGIVNILNPKPDRLAPFLDRYEIPDLSISTKYRIQTALDSLSESRVRSPATVAVAAGVLDTGIRYNVITPVGDPHGDLKAVIKTVKYLNEKNEYYRSLNASHHHLALFLGDYIDKGENSYGVVSYLAAVEKSVQHDFKFLVGNHDWNFLAFSGLITLLPSYSKNNFYAKNSMTEKIDRGGIEWACGEKGQQTLLSFTLQNAKMIGALGTVCHERKETYGYLRGVFLELYTQVPDFQLQLKFWNETELGIRALGVGFSVDAVHAGIDSSLDFDEQMTALENKEVCNPILHSKPSWKRFEAKDLAAVEAGVASGKLERFGMYKRKTTDDFHMPALHGKTPQQDISEKVDRHLVKTGAYLISGHHGYRSKDPKQQFRAKTAVTDSHYPAILSNPDSPADCGEIADEDRPVVSDNRIIVDDDKRKPGELLPMVEIKSVAISRM